MNFPASGNPASMPMGIVRVLLVYLALASLWFGLFDAVVAGLALEPAQRAMAHTLKVWIFVCVSAALWGAWLQRRERWHAPGGAGERRYRLLFESNPQPMWVFDLRSLRFLAVNDAAIEHYGYSRSEFLALSITDIRPVTELARLEIKLAELAGAPSKVLRQDGDWRHCVKGGREIEVQISANEVVFDGQRARLVLAHDVTERRELERQRQSVFAVHEQSEQALRLSETRYRLAASHGQVWDWDMVADCVSFPAPFWRELGHRCPPAGQVVEHFVALLHPNDLPRWQLALRAHIVQHLPYDFEFSARHASGQWRWFHTRGQAVWDAKGRATYMAGTTFDITARRTAQQALRTSQRELSELTQRLLAQETTTTRRVAQALHDHLGQTLAVARLHLDACMAVHGPAMPSAMKEQGHQIGLLLEQAVREVRQVLVDLRPPLLEDQGLAVALENEIGTRAVASGSADVLLEVADETLGRRWPADVEYGAFMVAREAIANARQHAGASLIRVLLGGTGGSLVLDVIDDGCGIPAPLVHGRPGHLGIVGMRERALAIGARFGVSAAPAGGTQMTLHWEVQT
jgi:PAS domain S-box-containing protein